MGKTAANQTVFVKRMNYFFLILFGAIALSFWFWGWQRIGAHHFALYTFAIILGLFMAFNVGGNDVANSFGTSVGAGTLTVPQALIIAAIFEVSGAVIAGGEVTKTIKDGIVDMGSISGEPMKLVFIMLSALFAAAFWLLFATKKGLPVSTTHAIIGGIVGASMTYGIISESQDVMGMVQWNKIGNIAISWVLSPVLGGIVSYVLFKFIRGNILAYNVFAERSLRQIKREKKQTKAKYREYFESLDQEQQTNYNQAMQRDAMTVMEDDYSIDDLESPYYKDIVKLNQKKKDVKAYEALQTWVPMLAALGGMIISSMVLFKGLKNVKLELSALNNVLIMLMIGATIWMMTFLYAKNLKNKNLSKATFLIFSWMQVFTASGFAFSHGSNDIANAIGPFVAIFEILKSGTVGASAAIPPFAMIAFGVALITGLWFIGKEVIQTIGHNLTKMHPSSGFASEISAASVVMAASVMGLPVSSTHILVGAVLGIGIVNHKANWGLMKPIFLAWVITLPAAAVLASIGFVVFNWVF